MLSQSEQQTTGSTSVVNPVKNRRATVRYHCAPAAMGKVYAPDDVAFQFVWIMDLSRTGVGLIMSKPLAIGMRILLNLRTADGSRSFDMYAQVVRCFRQVTADYFLGCKFANPLNEEDLEYLL